jgi:hypothetical protein
MTEDAPNTPAEGSQPATPEGSVNAALAAAAGAKAMKALLPLLSIWPPSQRTRDVVVHRLVQTFATSSVLSQRYGVVPEPDAEHAAVSKSVIAKSPTFVKEGTTVVSH